MKQTIGKLLYGILFVALAPAIIVVWEEQLAATGLELSAPNSFLGWPLLLLGIYLMIGATWYLHRFGDGLPMNAFPPKRLVRSGPFAWLRHPIYVGFLFVLSGYFLLIKSGIGLFAVLPTVGLSIFAIIYGYEIHDMRARFDIKNWHPMFGLPENSTESPAWQNRLSVFLLTFTPWLLVYEAALWLGPAPDAFDTYIGNEANWPVVEWTELIYVLTYPFVLLTPLIVRQKNHLRQFMVMGFWGTLIGGFCFLVIPFQATPREFEPTSWLGELLMLERSIDMNSAAGAFPSYHALWAFLAAWLYTRSLGKGAIWYGLASAIALSCISTGMHPVIDVLGALLLFFGLVQGEKLWRRVLDICQGIANSWQEWRLGPLRILNYGLYAGLAAFAGILILGSLAPEGTFDLILCVSAASVLGAGIWGQLLEGSSKLSRPFGYYGSLIAACASILIIGFVTDSGWLIAALFAIAAPFIQAIGRLRCLVQGCCHGRECEPGQGIVYRHPRSRVLYMADLGGVSLYPAPVYSIIFNFAIGILLLRAWTLGAPLSLIAGGYLILGSLGRFVEEAYRGEPQTARFGGLVIYQWLAIGGFLAGIVCTTMATSPALQQISAPDLTLLIQAIVVGVITWFAMGVDFPDSDRRFSRLAQSDKIEV